MLCSGSDQLISGSGGYLVCRHCVVSAVYHCFIVLFLFDILGNYEQVPYTADGVQQEDVVLGDMLDGSNMSYPPNYMQGYPSGDVNYFIPDFSELYDVASEEDIHNWQNEWRVKVAKGEPTSVIQEWFENIKSVQLPHIVGYRSCIHEHSMVKSHRDNLPAMGTLVGCDEYGACSK